MMIYVSCFNAVNQQSGCQRNASVRKTVEKVFSTMINFARERSWGLGEEVDVCTTTYTGPSVPPWRDWLLQPRRPVQEMLMLVRQKDVGSHRFQSKERPVLCSTHVVSRSDKREMGWQVLVEAVKRRGLPRCTHWLWKSMYPENESHCCLVLDGLK